jgi:hypothetical protein
VGAAYVVTGAETDDVTGAATEVVTGAATEVAMGARYVGAATGGGAMKDPIGAPYDGMLIPPKPP